MVVLGKAVRNAVISGRHEITKPMRKIQSIGQDIERWEVNEVQIPGTKIELSEAIFRHPRREHILWWEDGRGALANSPTAYIRGTSAWGKLGVAVTQMRKRPVTLYTGESWDNNVAVILPYDPAHLPAICLFCQSSAFIMLQSDGLTGK